ncbi:hypothetical protein [Paenibacillus sp. HJGM_3]|uniref:hypothetical protein n=1 Tax=Paenibacillus sp. HJGM_3 TaxID=3379816 RepID=UPI00385BEC3F
MPRTAIPIQTNNFQGGANVTLGAADSVNGMQFPNDGDTTLMVRNAGGSAITVTVVSVPDEAGRTGDLALSVTAGGVAIFGPFRPAWWNQSGADAGKVNVNFSSATSVTVGAIKQQK